MNIDKNPMFYFDTADFEWIEKTWNKLSKNMDASAIMGITTNPLALSRAGVTTIDEMQTVLWKLQNTLYDITNNTNTEIHVQLPHTTMSNSNEISQWITFITKCIDLRKSILVIKMPPFKHILDIFTDECVIATHNRMKLNVTGIADAATAMRCLSYQYAVNYVSIIPGRMEEAGINANAHLKFLTQLEPNTDKYGPYQNIIAGSMRNLKQLRTAIEYDAIPTLGASFFSKLTDDEFINFSNNWHNIDDSIASNYWNDLLVIDHKNHDVTWDFFNTMDKAGEPIYESFKNSNILKK